MASSDALNLQLDTPTSSQSLGGSVVVAPKKKKKEEPPKPNYGVSLYADRLEAILPISTISEGNCFEHWQKKHKRHKNQKLHVRLALNSFTKYLNPPYEIHLTRYSSKFLDSHDNLPMSFKFISDQIAESLFPGKNSGLADSDPRISWHFHQEKSKEKHIKIEIIFKSLSFIDKKQPTSDIYFFTFK